MTTTTVPLPAVLPSSLVIVLGNLKGGAGKTTTAFFLACYFSLVLKKKVLVIDADPLSQTGYSWHRKLEQGGLEIPFDLIAFPSPHIDDCIADHRKDYDIILADVGGESDAIFKAAVAVSDILLLTTGCNPSEVNRVASTYRSAEDAVNRTGKVIDVYVLLVKVPVVVRGGKNISTERRRARAILEEAEYLVLDAFASNWQWYRNSADAAVGDGAENPILDQGEYSPIGEEIVARYVAFLQEEEFQSPAAAPIAEPTPAKVRA